MKVINFYIHIRLFKACLSLGVMTLLLLCGTVSSFAQNTKGDRPYISRDSRFKTTPRKGDKKVKGAKRIRSSRGSVADRGRASSRRRAQGKEKPGRPIKPVFADRKPKNEQKAWRGDITGRRLRSRNKSSSVRNVYPQSGRYVRSTASRRSPSPGKPIGGRITVRSRTGKTKNVYSQKSFYVNNKSSSRQPTVISNRATVARINRLQRSHRPSDPGKRKVVPRSASRSFIARKSINVYANFPRPKRRGERATTKDLAGRPIRGRNYESQRPGVIPPSYKPYYGRKRIGDRPYTGPSLGGYRSATRSGESAWTRDIAKRRIRHRDRSSKRSVEGRPTLFGGFRSRTKPGEKLTGISPLPPRQPGLGAAGMRGYRGFLKGRRPLKGGGSVSGRLWNNNRTPIAVKTPPPGAQRQGKYPGNLRRFEAQPGFSDQGEEFTGVIKARRPLKGGGSVSGKLWNNRQRPIVGKQPKQGLNIGSFQGNIKAHRPDKGGGSVSGKLWNNREKPIIGRQPKQGLEIGSFQGNIKAHRPLKGGGSVSGRLWNNKETPIPVKAPPPAARKQSGYPGHLHRFEVQPGFTDQGEEFTGYIKLKKFRKNYIQNKLASEESIKKRRPEKSVYAVEGLQIKVKRRPYVENKNSSEDALLKLRPTEVTKSTNDITAKVKQYHYKHNPSSAEDALMVREPGKAFKQSTTGLVVKVRQYHYKHNPSSAEDALRVREPGRAFARSTSYQGNIRMRKFTLFEKNRSLHPDAQFVKTNKNNVKEERDMLTNFKLWWSRLFRKQETQPDHLKDKGHKPRYDKGEQGLWYE